MAPSKNPNIKLTRNKIKDFFSSKKLKELMMLAAIFIFSLIIRWMAVDHGFPLLTHPDEPAIIDPVYNMSLNRNLNPGVFYRPDQILYLLNFFFLNMLSLLKFGQNMAATFISNQLFFYYYSRLMISVFGSLIPVVAYWIGKEIKSKALAFPTAIVFALFPLYLKHSLYITPDIPITLFSLLIILLTLLYLNRNDEKFMYFAVIFTAFNTAEKYPGLISLSIVFMGMVLKYLEDPELTFKRDWLKFVLQGIKYLLVYISTLIITTPYLFIEHTKVIQSLIQESRSTHLGADNLGWGGNLIYYIQNFASWTNVLAVLFICIGILALLKWRNNHTLLLFYGGLYWILLSKLSLHWERWGLPTHITPLFLIAMGITYAWQQTKKRPIMNYFSIAIISGFFLYQFIFTIHTPIRMSFTDTRLTSLDYCREQGITAENTYFEGYTPLFPQSPKTIFNINMNESEAFDYIILSSYMFERFYAESLRFEQQVNYYEGVRIGHQLIEKFKPDPQPANILDRVDDIVYYMMDQLDLTNEIHYTGPVIEIYQIVN